VIVVSFDIRHSDFVIPPSAAGLFITEHADTHTSYRRFVNRNIQIKVFIPTLSHLRWGTSPHGQSPAGLRHFPAYG